MPIPIYILENTPGAVAVGQPAPVPTISWEGMKGQQGNYLLIHHETWRSTSLRSVKENKRPFFVSDSWDNKITASSTLAGAIKAAHAAATWVK